MGRLYFPIWHSYLGSHTSLFILTYLSTFICTWLYSIRIFTCQGESFRTDWHTENTWIYRESYCAMSAEVSILPSAMACTKCLRNKVSERASLGHFQFSMIREVCTIYGEDQIQVIKVNHQQQTYSLQRSSYFVTKMFPLAFTPHWVKKDSLLQF